MSLREALLRFGVKAFAQANILLHQVKHAITRLQENPGSLLPTLLPSLPDAHENSSARVHVVYPEVEPEKEPLGATVHSPLLSVGRVVPCSQVPWCSPVRVGIDMNSIGNRRQNE